MKDLKFVYYFRIKVKYHFADKTKAWNTSDQHLKYFVRDYSPP